MLLHVLRVMWLIHDFDTNSNRMKSQVISPPKDRRISWPVVTQNFVELTGSMQSETGLGIAKTISWSHESQLLHRKFSGSISSEIPGYAVSATIANAWCESYRRRDSGDKPATKTRCKDVLSAIERLCTHEPNTPIGSCFELCTTDIRMGRSTKFAYLCFINCVQSLKVKTYQRQMHKPKSRLAWQRTWRTSLRVP